MYLTNILNYHLSEKQLIRSWSHDSRFHHHEPISFQNDFPDPFQSCNLVTSVMAPGGTALAARRYIPSGISRFFSRTRNPHNSSFFANFYHSPFRFKHNQSNSKPNHINHLFPLQFITFSVESYHKIQQHLAIKGFHSILSNWHSTLWISTI